jgi:hypothetical protein
MSYITWANNVNKVIIDATSVSVGENATEQDKLESGGLTKARLKCSNPPDKFNVVMDFDFSEKGTDGFTELERFYAWYKYVHCYGVNPFKFPAILINSNRDSNASEEYYVITSAITGSKSGLSVRINMTWETYATGVIIIPEQTLLIDTLTAVNGTATVLYTCPPLAEPTAESITLLIDNVETKHIVVYDGYKTLKVNFTPLTAKGSHTVKIGTKTATFTVA